MLQLSLIPYREGEELSSSSSSRHGIWKLWGMYLIWIKIMSNLTFAHLKKRLLMRTTCKNRILGVFWHVFGVLKLYFTDFRTKYAMFLRYFHNFTDKSKKIARLKLIEILLLLLLWYEQLFILPHFWKWLYFGLVVKDLKILSRHVVTEMLHNIIYLT